MFVFDCSFTAILDGRLIGACEKAGIGLLGRGKQTNRS